MNSIASTIWRRGDDRGRATAAGRIEQVGDDLPLLVRTFDPCVPGATFAIIERRRRY